MVCNFGKVSKRLDGGGGGVGPDSLTSELNLSWHRAQDTRCLLLGGCRGEARVWLNMAF